MKSLTITFAIALGAGFIGIADIPGAEGDSEYLAKAVLAVMFAVFVCLMLRKGSR